MVNKNFTTFPILTTERLTLGPLTMADKSSIFDLRSNAEINKYLDRTPSKSIEDAENFIEKINSSSKKNNSIYWVIRLTSTKTFVGAICLFDFSSEKKSCEIGYELLTTFQRQGIMKEAIALVIDYVFQTLKLKRICAFTHFENRNSIHLLLGFNFVKSSATDIKNPNLNQYTLTV